MKYIILLLLLPYWLSAQITDTLQLQTIIQGVQETSGLIWHNEQLWTHDDSGGATALFQINPQTGATERTVFLQGVSNVDWEDVAHDATHFYIGDFGNNASGNRRDLKIYKILIDHLLQQDTIFSDDIEVISFVYPEQTNFNQQTSNSTDFDCEAMFIFEQQIHLFTKEWTREFTTHYTLPTVATDNSIAATKINTYEVNGLVTAADIAPQGDEVYLLAYGDVAENANPPKASTFGLVFQNFSGTDFLAVSPKRIEYHGGYFSNGQIEGVAYRNTQEVWISAEAILFFPARLYSASLLKTPVKEVELDIAFKLFPNPTSSHLQLEWHSPKNQLLIAEVVDSMGKVIYKKTLPKNESTTTLALPPHSTPQQYFIHIKTALGRIIATQIFQVQ